MQGVKQPLSNRVRLFPAVTARASCFLILSRFAMRILTLLVTLSLALVSTNQVAAQQTYTLTTTPGEAPPAATLSDVAWIAGHWQGEALGGWCEEIWAPPQGGSMMGMFKLVSEGNVTFYEILSLVEDRGSLALKLKHFNADLTGWEERDEVRVFPLVKIERQAAYFDGMTFRRIGPDTLRIHVAISRGEAVEEAEFLYHRVSGGL